ncbi:TPA: hypothetical protein VPF83_000874 [Streptococcus pyogenes]|uniref:Uncharacterized protein n=1 Tax=Streptococcus pyogenes serotype M49 (strain NZ131) TaxID=471876 RepID=A0A0H3BX04_STRPZ|nr:hypothetical protein [Streptococcus pyogenes]QBX10998.1 hypothetical protein JavanS529_0002 [Streptococcus satellite phage Javan529]ACI60684.1 hypothetical protein Spy49_0348 [Streptococcus pyogenes NZ131]MCX2500504.1 hypothetical protein [Streptococcus pyogenes]MCX2508574.1 hypothetical protein [Streptococcus pyogenes]NBA04124.1 hypothetical protein [Streptococcus pyogenes]
MTKAIKLVILSLFLFTTVFLSVRQASADLMMDGVTYSESIDSDTFSSNSEEVDNIWEKDRDFGKQRGFEAGKNGYGPNVSQDKIQVPNNIKYPNQYKNGYQEGYSQGWHQEHPFQGVIFNVFSWIWNVMSGLFT